ncbi:MAG TPA: sulfate ABC transporter ATP-binding protein [Methylococcus sp.]|nr:sulfate ABC transporter ATP-binding protein [Methylococcus sp.]
MSIEIRNIVKTFGNFRALQGIDLQIDSGELVALLGPSGCGKTTLLRIIAGLEAPDQGQIVFDGEDATGSHVRERRVGFVFQHYALFRHMTVFENIAFGLRVRPRSQRPPEDEIRRRVHALLELVQLDWLADRYPNQLSGGQRQRIALARALAVEPRVLLLDEPFGALDAKVRKDLRRWLRRLHDELHVTTVFVTHDQEEALEVADRVVVLNGGRIEQVGTPDEVYEHPATPFVCQFIGDVNWFHGRLHDGRAHIGDTAIELNASEHVDTERAVFYVRPHEIEILPHRESTEGIGATVRQVRRFGNAVRLELACKNGEGTVEADVSRDTWSGNALAIGDEVVLRFRHFRVFHP